MPFTEQQKLENPIAKIVEPILDCSCDVNTKMIASIIATGLAIGAERDIRHKQEANKDYAVALADRADFLSESLINAGIPDDVAKETSARLLQITKRHLHLDGPQSQR